MGSIGSGLHGPVDHAFFFSSFIFLKKNLTQNSFLRCPNEVFFFSCQHVDRDLTAPACQSPLPMVFMACGVSHVT
jgi:hypothetical protein